MRDAVIVAAIRTPVGKRNGALSGVHPVDLSAHVLNALAERAGLADTAVPVMREVPGSELVKSILPNGQLPFLFDGLRAPVSLPPQAPAMPGPAPLPDAGVKRLPECLIPKPARVREMA